jgi:hypothetical protein
MGKFAVYAVALAAVLATVPASAENLGGGPVRQGNQCWNDAGRGHTSATFGYWAACPARAGGVAAVVHRRHHRARS